jgi:hypothetical protein
LLSEVRCRHSSVVEQLICNLKMGLFTVLRGFAKRG